MERKFLTIGRRTRALAPRGADGLQGRWDDKGVGESGAASETRTQQRAGPGQRGRVGAGGRAARERAHPAGAGRTGGRLSRSACGRRSVRDVSGRLSVQKFRGLKLPQAISTRKPHPWLWEGVGAKVLFAGPPRLQAPGSWLLARWPPGTVMRDHTTSKEQQMRVGGFQNQVKGKREV